MAAAEEQIKILEMVQGGKISPEEGLRLLQALSNHHTDNGRDSHWVRIRINIPRSLVSNAVRLLTE